MLVIHASDLHLGRPLRSLARHEHLAPERFARCAERALARLVDHCLLTRASLLLIAGDLIDHWQRNFQLGLRLVHELERLESTGTLVFWVRGNHDAENRVIRNLLLPEHVQELGLDGVQTAHLEHLGVDLVGTSYVKRSTTTNLFAAFPAPQPQVTTIGMLHTSADGQKTGDHYAPCRRRELLRRGYQYLALGHVHEPEILSHDVPVAYSGCLQARGFFESGPRGCLDVEFQSGSVTSIRHHAADVVRFGRLPIDVSDAQNLDVILERVADSCRGALGRIPESALVIRCYLEGDQGIGILLSLSSRLRSSALRAAATRQNDRLSVDGFWAISALADAPAIRLDDEQGLTRSDF